MSEQTFIIRFPEQDNATANLNSRNSRISLGTRFLDPIACTFNSVELILNLRILVQH